MNLATFDSIRSAARVGAVPRTAVHGASYGQWLEFAPILYLALPTLIFLCGWFAPLYGIPAACGLVFCIAGFRPTRSGASPWERPPPWKTLAVIAAFVVVWTVLGGVGHLVYANFDWEVRDAVLGDLVRNPWPVVYPEHGQTPALLLRAPLAMYMPVAALGKLTSVWVADLALLAWIIGGLMLTFLLLLRDRPSLRVLAVRLVVFMAFSGMDVVGQLGHYGTYAVGQHLEWWAYLFEYPSMTTQLFWAPSHCLPAWILVAWLLGYSGRTLPAARAIVMVAFVPFWSPLAAIGIVPLLAVAMVDGIRRSGFRSQVVQWFDVRVILCVLVHAAFVYPYLVLGSENLPTTSGDHVRWVGEEFGARYIEFVLVEFAIVGALLLWRFRRDAMLVAAIATLFAIPFVRFGPANDLAMRASNPALALLAIYLGAWLSQPSDGRSDKRYRRAAIVLLLVGAVTPFNEVARAVTVPRWPLDTRHNLLEVARRSAPHYLTPRDRPWPEQFLRGS